MEDLDQPALLDELKARFNRDVIYTYVGEILVSVNPFKMIDVSTPTERSEALAQNDIVITSLRLPSFFFGSPLILCDAKFKRSHTLLTFVKQYHYAPVNGTCDPYDILAVYALIATNGWSPPLLLVLSSKARTVPGLGARCCALFLKFPCLNCVCTCVHSFSFTISRCRVSTRQRT
jgi:hypothetical protein